MTMIFIFIYIFGLSGIAIGVESVYGSAAASFSFGAGLVVLALGGLFFNYLSPDDEK